MTLTVTLINSVYSTPASVQGRPYDGETLYRALFFASGPIATKIPTLQKAKSDLPPEYKNLEGQIIKYVQGKEPNFFVGFARELQSGDRVKVAAAIRGANAVQKDALLAVTKNSKTQFAAQVRQQGSSGGTDFCGLLVDVYVFLVCCLLVLPNRESLTNEAKGLSFDRYVDEVVRAVPKTSAANP